MNLLNSKWTDPSGLFILVTKVGATSVEVQYGYPGGGVGTTWISIGELMTLIPLEEEMRQIVYLERCLKGHIHGKVN